MCIRAHVRSFIHTYLCTILYVCVSTRVLIYPYTHVRTLVHMVIYTECVYIYAKRYRTTAATPIWPPPEWGGAPAPHPWSGMPTRGSPLEWLVHQKTTSGVGGYPQWTSL